MAVPWTDTAALHCTYGAPRSRSNALAFSAAPSELPLRPSWPHLWYCSSKVALPKSITLIADEGGRLQQRPELELLQGQNSRAPATVLRSQPRG